MREIMAEHFSFATTTQYKSEYLMNENAWLRIELDFVEKKAEHFAVENEQLSSHN